MKRALKIIGIIIAILIVIVVALPFLINVNMFRPQIESELSSALGRQVKVGNLKLSIFSGSVSADDLSISDDPAFSTQPFMRAKTLDVGVDIWPLITSKTLHVNDFTITDPQVALLRNAAGRWNFSSLGNKSGSEAQASGRPAEAGKSGPANPAQPNAAPEPNEPRPSTTEKAAHPANKGETAPTESGASSPAANLSVAKLAIRNGTLSMANISTHEKPQVFSNVDVTVQNFAFNSQFPFNMTANLPGGGNMKLDGHAGPVDASDTTLTPLQAKITVNNLNVENSGFVNSASGFGGLVDFNGNVTSNGHDANASGTATVAKLKASPKGSPAPKPVDLKFNTTYDLQRQSGAMNADVTVGKAVAKLSGTYQIEPSGAVLNIKLAADNMPVDDLETLLPALGVTLPAGSHLQGGTLTANFTITGPTDKLVINGPIQLADTKLAGFDLGSKLSAVAALAGAKTGQDTEIKNFSTEVHVAPQGIQTQNVNLDVPAVGVITGNGTISPQNQLNYQMNAKLGGAGSVASGLTQLAGLGNKSATIPFSITGTASDPKFTPNVKGMLSNQLGAATQGQNPGNLVNSITGLFGKKKPK
ncbi:MAG TPA: AsmA family protein [Terriglobales bacterium]|nr:AsmA family protein [Terriglobales bacterium]